MVKIKFISAVLSALMLTASMGITASAEKTMASADTTAVTGTKADEETETTEATETTFAAEDDPSSESTDTSEEHTEEADSAISDYLNDDYYDTKGNASLIKSERIVFDTEEMQFIAVTTKDGNVFYVLINYTAENGEDQVFFLNKVDTLDLYSLLYMTDEEKENGVDPERVKRAEEAAMSNEVMDTTETEETEAAQDEAKSEAEQPKPASPMSSAYLMIGVIALIGVGAAGFFLLKKKPKNTTPAQEFEEDYEDIEFDDKDE